MEMMREKIDVCVYVCVYATSGMMVEYAKDECVT